MSLDAFQNWVLQTGFMISVLILIILMIRRPFARAFGANAAYALWSLPLIRLLLPGLKIPETWVPGFLRETPERLEAAPLNTGRGDVTSHLVLPDAVPEAVPGAVQWGVVVMGIWLGVAILWLIYQLTQQFRFQSHLMAQSSKPKTKLLAEIRRAAEDVGLRKMPNVFIGPDNVGPLVTGVFNPLIVLPQNFDDTFDTQQRHFALVHEFAHVKRRDLWAALAILIFRAVNWPNPIVHYASHKLRSDQEAACDAFVVKITGGQTAHSYAQTLVKAAQERGNASQQPAHLALSLIPPDEKKSKGD